MYKNYDLPRDGAARQPRQPLKNVPSRAQEYILNESSNAKAKRRGLPRPLERFVSRCAS
jgi:hypothetical protein